MNPIALNELIASRRSVFPAQFVAGKTVPHEIVQQIMINACWAPNHGRQEPWHFQVYHGEGLTRLAILQATLYKETSEEAFKQDRYDKLLQNPKRASHVISLGMRRTVKKNIPEIEDIEAVACAVQNIYLSVTAYGLGGYWTTGGITYLDEAKPYFGLEQQDKLLGFFYLGYVAVPSAPVASRNVNDKVIWIDE